MTRINPAAIGAFVIGAILLLIVGLMTFGHGGLFTKNVTYQLYFDKSVNGLNVGSAVMFRGIKIGQVTDIRLALQVMDQFSAETNRWPIQVTVKLLPKAFALSETQTDSRVEQILIQLNPAESEKDMKNWIRNMVLEKGMRAQLQTQSILTGLLYIELDLFENEVATQTIKDELEKGILPSRISAFERLYLSLNQQDFSKQIENVHAAFNVIGNFFQEGKAEIFLDNMVETSNNLKEMTGDAKNITHSLKGKKIGPVEISPVTMLIQLLSSISNILNKTDKLVTALDQNLPEILTDAKTTLETVRQTTTNLAPKLESTIQDANKLIKTAEKAAAFEEGPTAKLLQDFEQLTKDTSNVLQATHQTLDTIRQSIGKHAPIQQDLSKAIEDIREAAQSFRSLTDMLNQTPEALIRGRN